MRLAKRWSGLAGIALLMVSVFLLAHPPAVQAGERSFADAFISAGIAADPGDDDITTNLNFGAGFRPISHVSVGLEGFLTKWTFGGKRLLLDAYGLLYPFPNKFVNPYGKGGIGFVNIDVGDESSRPTEWRFIPLLGGGLELGWKYVSLFGEVTWRFNSRSGFDSNLISLNVGLSGHFYK
jgi:hypothetical protein